MPSSRWPTPIPVKRALRELGENVSTWRRLQGVTAAEVASRAGVSRGTVSRLENGSGAVSLENVLRIARALGLLDKLTTAFDPYTTDVGRLRSEESIPKRVRRPKFEDDDNG